MKVHLYRPTYDNSIITFVCPTSINGFNIVLFCDDTEKDDKDEVISTKLVSGYENTPKRKVHVVLDILNEIDMKKFKDGFVVSCVRLPYIYSKLIFNEYFTTPLSLVVMTSKTEDQVWHIFSVRRKTELLSTKKIKGVNLVDENGRDVFIKKELIAVTGNVPANFISILSKPISHEKNFEIVTHMWRNIKTKNDPVRIVCD
ncbi:ep23/ac146 [Cryptophlebia peltastica nucleopolyhedrovirus]|uniref:Ep23/ac146 n=1 Tax=Cryptophlebia peltastica nucleopolyhedrovirus TaxID=2304025 RepID=A0A346RNP1_9ABAC|nr:ep23/ac146 [Cryptophlebia peltastica nucleopolyhedrovirus]AXS67688.1 ep23/ac146 [Cryptophlebia peltastica nucleopolyhedrovirus]